MTEIELKARVADPASAEATIRGFAAFRKETVKSDTYWTTDGSERPNPAMDEKTVATAVGIGLSFFFALCAAIGVIAGAGKFLAIAVCLGGFVLSSAISRPIGRRICGNRRRPKAMDAARRANKIRVREEDGATVVTYKRKEARGDIEVNDEREFAIDDRAAFESLVADLGFSPAIRKEKKTKAFEYRAPDGTPVTIELSLVADLGWFVEIEILADSPGEAETVRAQATLRETLARCGIAESAIERRYYTDMLAEARSRTASR